MSRAKDQREGAAWTPRQRIKNDLIYAAIVGALGIARRIPRPALLALCRALGAIAYRALGRERALARARLALGRGAPPPEKDVRAAFLAAGETLADMIALLDPRERAGRTLSLPVASRAALRAAIDAGCGVVFVTAHLGSWERMAALLAEEGFVVATAARESYDARLTALYERLRAPRGVRSIYRGRAGSALTIARELRRGGAVGFLIDLPARVESAEIMLFGAACRIPVGAARIALARGARVVVGTPTQDGLVQIEPVPTADLAPDREGERALLERLARILDARIAAWPLGWLGLFAPPAPAAPAPASPPDRAPPIAAPPRLRGARDPR